MVDAFEHPLFEPIPRAPSRESVSAMWTTVSAISIRTWCTEASADTADCVPLFRDDCDSIDLVEHPLREAVDFGRGDVAAGDDSEVHTDLDRWRLAIATREHQDWIEARTCCAVIPPSNPLRLGVTLDHDLVHSGRHRRVDGAPRMYFGRPQHAQARARSAARRAMIVTRPRFPLGLRRSANRRNAVCDGMPYVTSCVLSGYSRVASQS